MLTCSAPSPAAIEPASWTHGTLSALGTLHAALSGILGSWRRASYGECSPAIARTGVHPAPRPIGRTCGTSSVSAVAGGRWEVANADGLFFFPGEGAEAI